VRVLNVRRLALAYAIGLVPALAVAIGQPVWSRVDEPAHYDVIAQYAAGVYPHDSVTTIRPETLSIMQTTGNFGFVVDNAYQRPDSSFQAIPSGLSDAEHVLWVRRHVYQYSYEAFQPPLYYALALPAWKLGDAIGGAFGALYAVRVFNALLAALLAPLAMLVTLRIWPARASAAWAAVVLTAALPGIDANLTSVTNDVLVSVLGALTLLVALGGRVTVLRAVAVGALLGAAILTKTTAVALVPAVFVALAWRRRGGSFGEALTALVVATVVVAPWIVSNVLIYGEVVTSKEQLAMSAFPQRTAALDFWSVSTLHSFVTFWSGDPFLTLATAVPLVLVAALLSALAIAGLVRAWRSADVSPDALTVAALAAVGAGLASVLSPVLAAFNAPGRLAYVGVVAVTSLVSVGLWHELPAIRLRAGALGVFAALSAVALAVLVYPASTAAADPGHPVIDKTQTLGAGAQFHGVYFGLQDCAVDRDGDVWLGVVVADFSFSSAEWSQSAEVLNGGQTLATTDYSRSTPLPMTLKPGEVATGWLWIGPESRLDNQGPLTVHFRNVAADGYHAIGDVVIATPLC
jgi:hypothetical protein